MPELNCPSCGAKVIFQSTVSLLAACAYCRSLVMRQDLKVENLGKIAELQPDGSPLQLGVRGEYNKIGFSVLGRIQMRYPEGYWNEWYLGFDDGRQGWLGEAQGLYALSFLTKIKAPLPDYEKLELGQTISIEGADYTVRDKRLAEYISLEGELPFRVPIGEKCPVADLAGSEYDFATIDYSKPQSLLFTGQHMEFDSFHFNGLKVIEGW